MQENYELLCKQELEKIKSQPTTPTLLLHSCCAPCSSHVITYLKDYFHITVLYYNPNISPQEEYEKRKQEQINLLQKINSPNKLTILDCDYENDLYEKSIKGLENEPEKGNRCTICFQLRLQKTAQLAKKHNFNYFTTTLTVSPYKNHILINKIGKQLEQTYQIKWLYSNFKKNNGYKHSIELSKQYNLYRQNYCGCIYSKLSRELATKELSNSHKTTNS